MFSIGYSLVIRSMIFVGILEIWRSGEYFHSFRFPICLSKKSLGNVGVGVSKRKRAIDSLLHAVCFLLSGKTQTCRVTYSFDVKRIDCCGAKIALDAR